MKNCTQLCVLRNRIRRGQRPPLTVLLRSVSAPPERVTTASEKAVAGDHLPLTWRSESCAFSNNRVSTVTTMQAVGQTDRLCSASFLKPILCDKSRDHRPAPGLQCKCLNLFVCRSDSLSSINNSVLDSLQTVPNMPYGFCGR